MFLTRLKSGKIITGAESGIIGAALILVILFTLSSDSFLTQYNLFNLTRTQSLYIFVALSQAVMLATGNMNLSVGAIAGLTAVIFGYSVDTLDLAWPLALLIALGVALLAGAFNGFVMTVLGVNSFIVSLSTLFIFTGFVYGISEGYSYREIPADFVRIGRGNFLGLPYLFYLMVGTLIAVWYMFRYTVFGRQVLATGSNLEAAKLSGINTGRIIMGANLLSAFFAGVGGLLWVSRLGSAQPAIGQNWLLISFAVAIIGGTALAGGRITAIGLFCGGLIMVLIKNGLILVQANVYFEQAFLGSIILLTILLDRAREVWSRKAGKS
ncbi:ABC transporter permease [uncultured Roseibium sp.]|uniref:ABC transporter permease n=1 Tax=uncultured Roseibium sp. TaxID=1936171 RepID=UPI0026197D9A|nr:ABC transporter permease [uncultured Roseibium sp.]